jgi:hypothetical protein
LTVRFFLAAGVDDALGRCREQMRESSHGSRAREVGGFVAVLLAPVLIYPKLGLSSTSAGWSTAHSLLTSLGVICGLVVWFAAGGLSVDAAAQPFLLLKSALVWPVMISLLL